MHEGRILEFSAISVNNPGNDQVRHLVGFTLVEVHGRQHFRVSSVKGVGVTVNRLSELVGNIFTLVVVDLSRSDRNPTWNRIRDGEVVDRGRPVSWYVTGRDRVLKNIALSNFLAINDRRLLVLGIRHVLLTGFGVVNRIVRYRCLWRLDTGFVLDVIDGIWI